MSESAVAPSILTRSGLVKEEIIYCVGEMGTVNGKSVAGAGIYFGPDDARNCSQEMPCYEQPFTKLRAALCAAIVTCNLTNWSLNAVVYTHNHHLYKGMSGELENWIRQGWMRDDSTGASTPHLWFRLKSLVDARRTNFGKKITFRMIRKNEECPASIGARELATAALAAATSSQLQYAPLAPQPVVRAADGETVLQKRARLLVVLEDIDRAQKRMKTLIESLSDE